MLQTNGATGDALTKRSHSRDVPSESQAKLRECERVKFIIVNMLRDRETFACFRGPCRFCNPRHFLHFDCLHIRDR
jgi:hypothetical protein